MANFNFEKSIHQKLELIVLTNAITDGIILSVLDKRYDETHEQKALILSGIFSLINISSQTTESSQIDFSTIEIPKEIGDREKKAYQKLQGISV